MKSRALMVTMAAACGLLFVSLMAGCADKSREMAKEELPLRPTSATLPCEEATDQEIIACIKHEDVKDVCRKLDVTCARYKNLQSFVENTWKARDGK